MKNINTLLIISLFFQAFIFQSCRDGIVYDETIDCSNCYVVYPDSVEVELEFHISFPFRNIPFTVYAGFAEISPVVYQDTASQSTVYIFLESNQLFSIVAEYYDRNNDRFIYVVNEYKAKPVFHKYSCDDECYYVENTYVDMRLSDKYYDIDFDR